MSEINMYVTQETFDKMREELQRMKSVDRPAASRAIAEAREKGDLKENAEYDAAKEAQGYHEGQYGVPRSLGAVRQGLASTKSPICLISLPSFYAS